MRKAVIIFCSVLCLIVICSLTPALPAKAATTIYVPDNFPIIQEAVDAASPGDTIIVRDGTYIENVNIDKEHLTLTSENGAEVTILQAANPNDHVFEVMADYVNISGFTVSGATGPGYEIAGIGVTGNTVVPYYIEGCNISNNIIFENRNGIRLSVSCNNIVGNNNIKCVWGGEGIYSNLGHNNTISGNTVSGGGGGYGIRVFDGYNNILESNTVEKCFFGIHIGSDANDKLRNNKISDSTFGFGVEGQDWTLSHWIQDIDTSNTINGKPILYLVGREGLVIDSRWDISYLGIVNCKNVTVKNRGFSGQIYGIQLSYSTDSRIENVTISDNIYGMLVVCCSNISVVNNNLQNLYGINLRQSNNNIIYLNNFTNPSGNILSSNSVNAWNSPAQITYIYNGKRYTSYLGNYWSDYTGSDANEDGIGDVPYSVNSDKDNYPLMKPSENYKEGKAVYVGRYSATAYAYPEEDDNRFGSFNSPRMKIKIKKEDGTTIDVSVKRLFCAAMKMNGGGLVNANPQEYIHLVKWTLAGNIFEEIDEVMGSQGRPLEPYQSIARCPRDIKLSYGDRGYFLITGINARYEFSVDDTCPACCKRGKGIDVWLGVGKEAYYQALRWGVKQVNVYVYR